MALNHLDALSALGVDVSRVNTGAFTQACALLDAGTVVVQVGSHHGHSRNDPIHAHVHERGWTGVAVEPLPYLFAELERRYAGTGMACCNAAISSADGRAKMYSIERATLLEKVRDLDYGFREAGCLPRWADQIGSLSREHVAAHLPGEPIEETEVEVLCPATLCRRFGLGRCDVLHVDTEGHDATVLGAWDFEALKPAHILFECKHMDGVMTPCGPRLEEVARLLRGHGYSLTLVRPEGRALCNPHTLAGHPFWRSPAARVWLRAAGVLSSRQVDDEDILASLGGANGAALRTRGGAEPASNAGGASPNGEAVSNGGAEILARSFGVTLEPPSITLVYSIGPKLRKRSMPVRGLKNGASAADVAARLIRAHPSLLGPHVVSGTQLERLCSRLIGHAADQADQAAARLRVVAEADVGGTAAAGGAAAAGSPAISELLRSVHGGHFSRLRPS
jgi:FkbM family methyltransferase